MNARLRHEADIARLHQTSEALAQAESAAGRAQEVFDIAAARLQSVRDEIAAAVAPILPAGTTVLQLEAWVGKRAKALDVRTHLMQAERELREAEADAKDAWKRLSGALAAAGVTHATDADADALRATAQAVLDRATELKALRDDVAERRREVTTRERNVAAAAARDRTWRAAWAAACAGCWLGDRGTLPCSQPFGRFSPRSLIWPPRSTGALRSSIVSIRCRMTSLLSPPR